MKHYILIALFASLFVIGSTACSGELIPTGSAGVGGADGGGGPIVGGGAEALFLSDVQPLFQAQRPLGPCTMCHQGGNGGILFLGPGPADNYTAILNSGLVTPGNPAASTVHTYPQHTGDAFPANEQQIIANWIAMEGN